MGKIKLLDKAVSELIAAGEVIERPASIVKELVENCIDADSTAITIEIKNGGISYIRITDNGCGISSEDVETAFLRHATSKVSVQDDLDNISTLGFRGEALASISAVSRLEMLTKTKDEQFGTRICLEGGQVVLNEKAGCVEGTTIIVRDLFYNVPARLKFLKKHISEGNAIASIIDKIAISHPEISFKLLKENKLDFQTTGDGQLINSIYSVLGKDVVNSLIPINYEYQGYKVSGYISKPMESRNNRAFQYFYVNGRYVKSVTAGIALEEAYKGSIMVGKYPICILNITTPFSDVDVNVHPAKIEIRFVQEKIVFDLIYYGVKSALKSSNENIISNNNIRININNFDVQEGKQATIQELNINNDNIQIVSQNKVDYAVKSNNLTENESYVFSKPNVLSSIIMEVDEDDEEFYVEPQKIEIEQENRVKNIENIAEQKPNLDFKIIGELFKTYVLVEVFQSLILVDKHAAHEKILYEKLKKQNSTINKQALLAPITITLSREEHLAISENLDIFESLGFTIDNFGANTFIIREVPVLLVATDIKEIVYQIAFNLKNQKKDLTPDAISELFHSIACRCAIKANDNSTVAELKDLVEKVLSDPEIRYCPHGRPIIITMTKKEIEKRFGRV